MSFRNKTEFFAVPADGLEQKVSSKPLVAASSVYICSKNRVLRIVVGSADVFINLQKIKMISQRLLMQQVEFCCLQIVRYLFQVVNLDL